MLNGTASLTESTLNIFDEQLARERLRSKGAITVYRDRAYRGFRQFHSRNCFCLYSKDCGDVWHIEPCYYVSRPDEMVRRLQIETALAKGGLSRKELNFTDISLNQDYLPELIARSFGARHGKPWQLFEFAAAKALVFAE